MVLGLLWSNPALAFNYLSDFGATGGSAIVGLIMIIILFFMVKDREGTGFDERKWREYNKMLEKKGKRKKSKKRKKRRK